MAKKCIYCKAEISEESVIDFCARCGHGVWGERMFNTIVANMEKAKTKGDLFQGSVSIHSMLEKGNRDFAKRPFKA